LKEIENNKWIFLYTGGVETLSTETKTRKRKEGRKKKRIEGVKEL